MCFSPPAAAATCFRRKQYNTKKLRDSPMVGLPDQHHRGQCTPLHFLQVRLYDRSRPVRGGGHLRHRGHVSVVSNFSFIQKLRPRGHFHIRFLPPITSLTFLFRIYVGASNFETFCRAYGGCPKKEQMLLPLLWLLSKNKSSKEQASGKNSVRTQQQAEFRLGTAVKKSTKLKTTTVSVRVGLYHIYL